VRRASWDRIRRIDCMRSAEKVGGGFELVLDCVSFVRNGFTEFEAVSQPEEKSGDVCYEDLRKR
jgi:hypothetical protein